MANIAIDHPVRAAAGLPSGVAKRLRLLLRYLRRARHRRRVHGQLLAQARDPHIFADIGFAIPRRNILERCADAMLEHRR